MKYGNVKQIISGVPYVKNGKVFVTKSLSGYDIDGELRTVIARLSEYEGLGYENISYESDYDNNSPEFVLSACRDATPEEAASFANYETEMIALREEREKQQYEILKKKFK